VIPSAIYNNVTFSPSSFELLLNILFNVPSIQLGKTGVQRGKKTCLIDNE
jgi:hypothetical protein